MQVFDLTIESRIEALEQEAEGVKEALNLITKSMQDIIEGMTILVMQGGK